MTRSSVDMRPFRLHAGKESFELVRQPSSNARLTRLTGIFESVGCMLGSDHLLEAANLTHAHLPHEPHFSGHHAWVGQFRDVIAPSQRPMVPPPRRDGARATRRSQG